MLFRSPTLVLWCISLLSWLSAGEARSLSAADPVLHLHGQIRPEAKLLDLNPQSQWVFSSAGQTQAYSLKEVVRWGSWPGIRNHPAVWLSDGSWLAGSLHFNSGGEVSVRSEWLEEVTVPLRQVRGLVLTAPVSMNAWLELQSQLKAASGNRDLLWLSPQRQVAGVLQLKVNDTRPQCQLENAGKIVPIEFKEIHAIAFSPALFGALPDDGDAEQLLALADGSQLRLRTMGRVGGQVKLTLQAGLELRSLDSAAEFVRSVRLLASPGGALNLGQVAPASYRYLSQGALQWSLGSNRDAQGRPLVADGGQVPRGLATHSTSQVAFRWDGSPARFLCELRLAPTSDGALPALGSVMCQVLVAKEGRLQSVATETLKRDGPSFRTFDVDVTNAKLVVLVTEPADLGQYGDHVLWLDARINKQ